MKRIWRVDLSPKRRKMIAIVGAAMKGGDEWVKEIRWVGGLGIALRLNSHVGLGSPEHRHHGPDPRPGPLPGFLPWHC